MNVLIDGLTPKVCSLKKKCAPFLDHRRDISVRRSKYWASGRPSTRLERLLEGFIIRFPASGPDRHYPL
jgi:topoisomerase-4 subunit A